MLSIKNLKVNVDGKAILKGIDLEIGAGEVHAIMGPNGSGKSTLANVLAGREGYEVTDGEVLYRGKNLLEMAGPGGGAGGGQHAADRQHGHHADAPGPEGGPPPLHARKLHRTRPGATTTSVKRRPNPFRPGPAPRGWRSPLVRGRKLTREDHPCTSVA